jgi:putative transposase
VPKYVQLGDQRFRERNRTVGSSWRPDKTYVQVKGAWKCLYREVHKTGATIDFLLTAKRSLKAAPHYLRKAIECSRTPVKLMIDKSGGDRPPLYYATHKASIVIPHVKYLNNMVEQDHRSIKRLVRPMIGFKSFWSAAVTLSGIELIHMVRKGPMMLTGYSRPGEQLYSLAD